VLVPVLMLVLVLQQASSPEQRKIAAWSTCFSHSAGVLSRKMQSWRLEVVCMSAVIELKVGLWPEYHFFFRSGC